MPWYELKKFCNLLTQVELGLEAQIAIITSNDELTTIPIQGLVTYKNELTGQSEVALEVHIRH